MHCCSHMKVYECGKMGIQTFNAESIESLWKQMKLFCAREMFYGIRCRFHMICQALISYIDLQNVIFFFTQTKKFVFLGLLSQSLVHKLYSCTDKLHINIIITNNFHVLRNTVGRGDNLRTHESYLPVRLPHVLSLPIRVDFRSVNSRTECKTPEYMA